jgi:hypothetical protein
MYDVAVIGFAYSLCKEEVFMDNQNSQSDPLPAKSIKMKPVKVLPTDRLGFEKQLSVLKACVAASGAENNSFTNNDVSSIVGLHAGTISNCNAFFNDVGLLIRDGNKQKPSDELVAYAGRLDWEPEIAGHKLAPLLEKSWFAKSLLPKLSFRTLTRDEAVGCLADEAKASKEYKPQLDMLLEYLHVSGIVNIDGNSVILAKRTNQNGGGEDQKDRVDGGDGKNPKLPPVTGPELEKFVIPIPGKPSAIISVPKNLDDSDWTMLTTMLDAYIKRLQNKPAGKTNSSGLGTKVQDDA